MIRYTDLETEMLPALVATARESFVDTFGHLYAPEDLSAFLTGMLSEEAYVRDRATRSFRLAWDGGELAGFIKIGPLTLPMPAPLPGAWEIAQLYIRKPWHGAGIAQALTDWSIEQGRAAGAPELCLSVYTDNHRAKRFYARYGFEDVGPYIFLVGNHEDEDRLMRLPL